jgi:hypothetical protein
MIVLASVSDLLPSRLNECHMDGRENEKHSPRQSNVDRPIHAESRILLERQINLHMHPYSLLWTRCTFE